MWAWREGQQENTHLHFANDLVFRGIRVSGVDDADDIGLGALYERDRCPENTFAPAAGVAEVTRVSYMSSVCCGCRLTNRDERNQQASCFSYLSHRACQVAHVS